MITLTETLENSALQVDRNPDGTSFRFGPAPFFYDKENFPKGTPHDGLINVILMKGLNGRVIARVKTKDDAIRAIESESGHKVSFKKSRGRSESRAESRFS